MDRYEIAALAAVNDVRARVDGFRTPVLAPGRRGKPAECPMAISVRAARGGVSCFATTETIEAWISLNAGPPDVSVELEGDAAEFQRRFDRGLYPHLDIDLVLEKEGW